MFVTANFDDPPPELNWTCVTLEPAQEVKGRLAALPWGVWLHFVGADKPCLTKLTQGRLKCPFCPLPQRGKYYVPLLEEPTRKQVVVLVPKTAVKTVSTMIVGMGLRAHRAKGETSPSRLFKGEPAGEPLDETGKRIARSNRDIRQYLLHLWQIRELTEFYGQVFRPSVRSQMPAADTLPFAPFDPNAINANKLDAGQVEG